MAWIESHQALRDHPKVTDLMNTMQWDLDTTIGKLHRLWWWCVDYAENGDLRKHNDARIAGGMGVAMSDASRLIEALVQACWLERDPYFRVHDWWEYIGPWLRSKYKRSPEKWESVRNLYVTVTQPHTNQPTNLNQPTPPNPPFSLAEAERHFEVVWKLYPDRTGRKAALKHFLTSVRYPKDLERIDAALKKYLTSERVKKGFIQNGSTWFNNWEDWTDHQEPKEAIQKDIQARSAASKAISEAQERKKAEETAQAEAVFQADLKALRALPPASQERIRAAAEAKIAGNKFLKRSELTIDLEMVEIFRKEREGVTA